jgi:hypothetical protein
MACKEVRRRSCLPSSARIRAGRHR